MPVALCLILAACSGAGKAPVSLPTTTDSPSPAASAPALLPRSPASELTPALVTRVIDGDTIEVAIGGRSFRVRYIGIDTPETVHPQRPVECFGKQAADRNRQLVEGKMVGLEKDVSDTDSFGRLLRYVWADGRMVNAVLVEEGFALASTFPPDVRYAELFAALQARAREEGRGLWAPGACETPEPTAAAGGACDYSGTEQPVIKGNLSTRTGEKIYHVPGGEFYDHTVIDESAGERWFCTEAEAVAAGWRKSKR